MTTAQKIRKARELVQNEEDGSIYLQSVCTVKELKEALAKTKNKEAKETIQDAITIREYNNLMKRKESNVALQTNL
jgi:hypothetical protein